MQESKPEVTYVISLMRNGGKLHIVSCHLNGGVSIWYKVYNNMVVIRCNNMLIFGNYKHISRSRDLDLLLRSYDILSIAFILATVGKTKDVNPSEMDSSMSDIGHV